MKRVALQRHSGIRRRRKTIVMTEGERQARDAWKAPKAGFCECGCSKFSMHLERHHVIYQQHVRVEGGDVWCLANSMLLHPFCHGRHHSGQRRIRIEFVPAASLSFAVDLFGELRAAEHVNRYYDCTVTI